MVEPSEYPEASCSIPMLFRQNALRVLLYRYASLLLLRMTGKEG